jgi:multidrug efflux system outer membrane protein
MDKRTVFARPPCLVGCTMAPSYQRPDAPVSETFPQGGVYAVPPGVATGDQGPRSANDAPATDIGWRDFFADPRLQQLVEIALKNNRDLRVSVLNVDAARAQYQITRAELFPRSMPWPRTPGHACRRSCRSRRTAPTACTT